MEKSRNSGDKQQDEMADEEINRFKKLIDGHRKLLTAIGEL